MKNFKITLATDDPVYNGEHTATWWGYDEKQAIGQAMLYHAYNGARKLEVLEIHEV